MKRSYFSFPQWAPVGEWDINKIPGQSEKGLGITVWLLPPRKGGHVLASTSETQWVKVGIALVTDLFPKFQKLGRWKSISHWSSYSLSAFGAMAHFPHDAQPVFLHSHCTEWSHDAQPVFLHSHCRVVTRLTSLHLIITYFLPVHRRVFSLMTGTCLICA